MKEETKELIKWAMAHLADYKTKLLKHEVENVNEDAEKEMCKKFAEFINSLPEIESHLCRGGYIQDRNGTPCCEGDQIINPSLLDGKKELGKLYWSVSDCRFYCKIDDKCYGLTIGVNGFEKVEE